MSQIDRCFDILELFFKNPHGLALSEVSKQTSIPPATAHRMLNLIKLRGYLTQDSREKYHLSLLLPSMGKNFIASTGFAELHQPHIDQLAEITGEHIRLAAVVDSQLIWVLRAVVSSHGLQYRGASDTKIVPHITASGKLWLSTLTDEEAMRIASRWNIEQAKEYGGPKGISSIHALLSDLGNIRKTGFSTAIEEAEVGVCAIAVGIFDKTNNGKLLGTLSLAGPTARLNKQTLKNKAPIMKSAADKIQETWSLWASMNVDGIDRT